MVQVLKEELRQSILQAAKDEFLRNGYVNGSVRTIAAQVGISAGNMYRYFAGKEALYDAVVVPVYTELEKLIHSKDVQQQEGAPVVEQIIDALSMITGEFRKSLLILIDGSKGTRHETAVEQIYAMMADNVQNHIHGFNVIQNKEVFTEQVAWPISVSFMQGYFEIVRRHAEPDDYREMLRQYVLFWYQGLQAVIRGT